MLHQRGIENAYQLKNAQEEWIRKERGIVGLRTVHELKGISCILLEEMPKSKKSTAVTRSFGSAVDTLFELKQALSAYASRAGEKLRQSQQQASSILVFFQTGTHDKNHPYRSWSATVNFFEPTFDSRELVKAASTVADNLFEPGYKLKKAGVILLGLTSQQERQLSLFETRDTERSQALMQVMDAINSRYGRETIQLASSGIRKKWQVKAEKLSPRYTTDWNELPIVK